MKLNSYWINSGLFTFGQRGFIMLFNIVGFMILARVLSKEELGIWALFLIFVTIVEVSKNGFIKNAIIKYLASSEKEDLGSLLLN